VYVRVQRRDEHTESTWWFTCAQCGNQWTTHTRTPEPPAYDRTNIPLLLLWKLSNGIRCITASDGDKWLVRVEEGGQVLRSELSTSAIAAFHLGMSWRSDFQCAMV
jgi:hypothetical protein